MTGVGSGPTAAEAVADDAAYYAARREEQLSDVRERAFARLAVLGPLLRGEGPPGCDRDALHAEADSLEETLYMSRPGGLNDRQYAEMLEFGPPRHWLRSGKSPLIEVED